MNKYLEPTVVFSVIGSACFFAGHNYFRHHFISLGLPSSIFMPPFEDRVIQGFLVLWARDNWSPLLTATITLIALFLIAGRNYIWWGNARVKGLISVVRKFRGFGLAVSCLLFAMSIQWKAQGVSENVTQCFSLSDKECPFYPHIKVNYTKNKNETFFYGKWIYVNNAHAAFLRCDSGQGKVMILATKLIDSVERFSDLSNVIKQQKLNCFAETIEYQIEYQLEKIESHESKT